MDYYKNLADISTTIGVVISTLTLVSAFRLYKLGKRDIYLKEVRNILIAYQYNSENLNKLITYEISHELIHNVVYSKQIDRLLSKVFEDSFVTNKEKPELEKDLENLNPITVAIHSELLKQFDTILKLNSQEASKIYTDYPSLYRVYKAVDFTFSQTIEISKQMVRDEELFKNLIIDAYDSKFEIKNIEDLKEFIFFALMSLIQGKHNDNDQKDIDDILNILMLTTNGLMRLSDKELFIQKEREKKIEYKDLDSTNDIFEDLLQAEKGLRLILKEDELLIFREYSTRIKVRNEK